MNTYLDIKKQNKQDAFSAMYMCLCQSLIEICGSRVSEGVIREAVRRVGTFSGTRQLEKFKAAGIKTNLHNLYHVGLDYVDDPRVHGRQVVDQEDRQIWEVFICPLADYWKKHHFGEIGTFFCEEFQYSRIAAYTEGVGQLNLSAKLTHPLDNYCCFAAFFREANMSKEQAKRSFAHCDLGYTSPSAPPSASFDEGIRWMTIALYCELYETTKEKLGYNGVCAISEGLNKWVRVETKLLKEQAAHTLLEMDAEFVLKNFPISICSGDDLEWDLYNNPEAKQMMQRVVLDGIASACVKG